MAQSRKGTVILLVLGLPFAIFGGKKLYQAHRFVAGAEKADGVIIEMSKGPSAIAKYHPRVRFQTKQGETIEFVPGNGSNPPMYEVGDHVPVIYAPGYPNAAVIHSFIELWCGPVIYAGLGLFFLLYAGIECVKTRRQTREAA